MSSCDPQEERCITCGDVGIEMEVVALQDGLALCAADGEQREVEIALLDDVLPGDVLLVHADVALVRVR